MKLNPNKVAEVYDIVAKEYAEKFGGDHEKKPQDREILYRFSQEVVGKKPIWDFGCGPGQTTQWAVMGSDHANYLIFCIKSSENGCFLVLNIPFWVQNCWSKDFYKNTIWLKRSFWGSKSVV